MKMVASPSERAPRSAGFKILNGMGRDAFKRFRRNIEGPYEAGKGKGQGGAIYFIIFFFFFFFFFFRSRPLWPFPAS